MVAAIAQRQEVTLYLPEFRRSRDLFCAARAAARETTQETLA